MYEKVDKCPICESKDFVNTIIAKDHTTTKESFAIVACKKCGFHFTNPRPNENNLAKYYESNTYISHADQPKSITDWIYFLVRKYTMHSKVTLVKNLIGTTGTILDYGCGTGDFLKECKQKKYEVRGIEPNNKAREIATKKIGKQIDQSISTLNDNKKIDIITLWHVLEHIQDLNETINQLTSLLKKKGYLIIAVPNRKAYDAHYYKEYWAAYDVPRHLYHFTRTDIKAIAKKHKLKVKSIMPQFFDAFYVSLLSEKYQQNKYPLIKGFVKGLKSNIAAAKGKKEYSSLIYILRK